MQKILPLLLFVASGAVSAQYLPDWTHRTFYEQLNFCRATMMLPAARDFERRALTSGRSAEESKNEAIAFLPVLEEFVTTSCYCAMNELAKSITLSKFVEDRATLMGYLQSGRCKEASDQAARSLRSMSKERAAELRLK